MTQNQLNRRNFLKTVAASGSYVLLLEQHLANAVTHPGSHSSLNSSYESDLGFFTPLQRLTLGRLCDSVVPGVADLGAVRYIETLLTAFDSNPPKIFAGGPFSGRGAGGKAGGDTSNQFENFIPLNRYQEAAWRLYLYGSDAIPGGAPNFKLNSAEDINQDGLRDILLEGVGSSALLMPESGMTTKPTPISTVFSLLSSECRDAIETLTIEACLCAPEYGGNKDMKGWKWVHYAGDRAPYGFSHFDETTESYQEDPLEPVSKSDPGKDTDPLTLGPKLIFRIIAAFTNGRTFY